jgi:hypothetical protein
MPGLSQSRIAALTNLPPTTVRHVLRRTADVEVAHQKKTNGNVPTLVGAGNNEKEN